LSYLLYMGVGIRFNFQQGAVAANGK